MYSADEPILEEILEKYPNGNEILKLFDELLISGMSLKDAKKYILEVVIKYEQV